MTTRFVRRPVRFEYDPIRECFTHDLEHDFHIFCIWEKARNSDEAIQRFLAERFVLRSASEVVWSTDLMDQNFGRLYKTLGAGLNKKHESVGAGPFLCLVVEDVEPKYHYELSVSGVLELSNRKVVEAKREIRSWFGDFFVHSTHTPFEFAEQVNFFFSRDEIDAIAGGAGERVASLRDPVGARGWPDFATFFDHLNRTCDYVVLRGTGPDGSIVRPHLRILCEDTPSFFSAANAGRATRKAGRAECEVAVGNTTLRVEVRSIGDGSLDLGWQREILRRSELDPAGIRVPRQDDRFFFLVYEVASLPASKREAYTQELRRAGAAIGVPADLLQDLCSDTGLARVLRAYFKGTGYSRYVPSWGLLGVPRRIDRSVGREFTTVHRRLSRSLTAKVVGRLRAVAKRLTAHELWRSVLRGFSVRRGLVSRPSRRDGSGSVSGL